MPVVEVKNAEIRKKLSEVNCRTGGRDAGFDPFYGAPIYLIVLAGKDCPARVCDGSPVLVNLMPSGWAPAGFTASGKRLKCRNGGNI